VIEFQKNRQEQIDKLEAEMQSGLSKLRSNFVIIAAVAMSLLIVGGWVFVSLTMKPLQHLSSAVSQISPKDFQLPIEVKSLPKEVRPVSERLKDALFELKKVFEREKRAAADISHELRTPLAALTTTLDVTLRKPRTDEEYREVLRDCRDIAGQMSHLVERLLLLAWIDAGADRLQMQDVEVSKLISECTTVGKPLAEAQGLRFRVMLPEELTVRTDRDKLREVLMNLVHNAIEYNRPGGEIEVTASSNGTAGIVFEVRDTGIGIAREMQDKIFERFYRGDPSRNAAGVHAGLGLAIVKEYIDRLGGTLLLDSTVGQGSRFRIELPLG
jgi:signal transduction histidine kinase